ncbi:hypothetical protein [Erythrobacter donghaensis]|uniref:hypothetical protein n=1 Tax=Erythrobacter donghaensis TaxID=267135 RepID=UPI001E2CAB92|nr:hypothetical protein [Erythrobacter donghaensis]
MVTAVTATRKTHPLASGLRELGKHPRGDGCLPCAFQHCRCAVCIDARLVANGFEAGNALLEVRIVQVGNADLDCIVKPLETKVGFGSALFSSTMCSWRRSVRSCRRSRTAASTSSSRAGSSKRSSRCLATSVSSFSIETVMPLHAVGPCRALVEQV